jgi:hypothetical protein
MSANPPSFRLPFTLPEDVHPSVAQACRYLFNGLLDANNGIALLKKQGVGGTAASVTVTPLVSSAALPSQPSTIGNVNLLASSLTAYTTQQSDFGGLIVVNSAVAFAYSLNSSLTTPFYVCVLNIGAGVVTSTPTVGNVNNVASVRQLKNQFAIFFYDGVSWWALITVTTAGLTAYANNGAAIAGGLVAGDLYRTGADPDTVCVVH